MKNVLKNKIKISTIILLTTIILITASTLIIAIYSIYFVGHIEPGSDIPSQLLIFQENLKRLIVGFLVYGVIAAYYLTKMFITPLTNLVKKIKELAKGNFDCKLEQTNYIEINELIDTYNKMAESLNEMYMALDKKVKERTLELENANNELKSTQVMMVHSEKMRSLGELVAGITHEINNPINFVHGNMVHLKNYTQDLLDIIELYGKSEKDLSEEKQKEIEQLKKNVDLEFIKEDLPSLIKSCHEGTERTKNIILDLKNFSRLDEMVINEIDLPKEIDTTLNILHNKLKNKVEIVKDYDDNLPSVEGYGGQLNQVFMNIFDNSCYAIKDKGTITIRIHKKENSVIIEIQDSGCGMNKEQQAKIFDPFFTTKPVGEGTGLGMSISYKVIQRHNGTIKVDSEEGKGTKFTICIPLKMKEEIESK